MTEGRDATALLEESLLQAGKEDPWFFVRQFCITIDEHDHGHPYKPFPDLDYLRWVTYDWEANPKYLLPKSRQMMMSWLMVALHLWQFCSREAQLIFFQSKKEEDACRLVDRAWFMYERLPEYVKKAAGAKKVYGKMISEERNCTIWGIPQGADQIRSNVPSAVLSDEMAFQNEAEMSFVATLPALEGGGRYTGISSAHPGFFERLVMGEAA